MNDENEKHKLEITTVWSFPDRGKWATHNAKYEEIGHRMFQEALF